MDGNASSELVIRMDISLAFLRKERYGDVLVFSRGSLCGRVARELFISDRRPTPPQPTPPYSTLLHPAPHLSSFDWFTARARVLLDPRGPRCVPSRGAAVRDSYLLV